jgi:hypothetical protein
VKLLKRAPEKGIPLPESLHELLLKDGSTLSPEVVYQLFNELDSRKKLDTDSGIQLLYAALEHFAGRFDKEPALRKRTEPLLARLEALEEREADEFEEEFNARFQVKPGEISHLYQWGRGLLEE